MVGAASYRLARHTSTWLSVASTGQTTLTIPELTGVNEYALFAVLPTQEAVLVGHFFTSH